MGRRWDDRPPRGTKAADSGTAWDSWDSKRTDTGKDVIKEIIWFKHFNEALMFTRQPWVPIYRSKVKLKCHAILLRLDLIISIAKKQIDLKIAERVVD